MMRAILWVGVLGAFLAAAPNAHAAIQYGQGVTNDFFNGSGIGNTNFTTDRVGIVELALKAHVRFPTPTATTNNNGLNSIYGSFEAQGYAGTNNPGGPRASWNFDWSINTDTSDTTDTPSSQLNDFTYLLQLDYDPTLGVDFAGWDPIASPGTVNSYDQTFGYNSTLDGTTEVVGTAGTYAGLISTRNIAQNSGQLNFFNGFLGKSFNPDIDGTYEIRLTAFGARGIEVASTSITVVVGDGGGPAVVPEAASFLAWGGLACCGGLFAMRKKLVG